MISFLLVALKVSLAQTPRNECKGYASPSLVDPYIYYPPRRYCMTPVVVMNEGLVPAAYGALDTAVSAPVV